MKSKNKIKVSVIMPIYNGEKIIEQYLPQVLNQSLKEVNFFLVNDGSTDETLKILKKYEKKDSRITVLTQENGGAGSARNLGLKYLKENPELRGEYLWFPDLGDDFDPDFLLKMWAHAQLNESDLVRTSCFKKGGVNQGFRFRNLVNKSFSLDYPFSKKSIQFRYLTSLILGAPWDKLQSSELVFQNNLYFDPLTSHNDVTFDFLCFILAEKISYLSESLVYYNTSLDQIKNNIQGFYQNKTINFHNSLDKHFQPSKKDLVTSNSISSSRGKNFINVFKAYESCQNQLKERGLWEIGKMFFFHRALSGVRWSYDFIDQESKTDFFKTFDLYCQKFEISEEKIKNNYDFDNYQMEIFELAKEYQQ